MVSLCIAPMVLWAEVICSLLPSLMAGLTESNMKRPIGGSLTQALCNSFFTRRQRDHWVPNNTQLDTQEEKCGYNWTTQSLHLSMEEELLNHLQLYFNKETSPLILSPLTAECHIITYMISVVYNYLCINMMALISTTLYTNVVSFLIVILYTRQCVSMLILNLL